MPISCPSQKLTADIDTVNCRNWTVLGDGDLNLTAANGHSETRSRAQLEAQVTVRPRWRGVQLPSTNGHPETRSTEQVEVHGKGCSSPHVPPGGKMTGCVFGQGDGTRSTQEPAGLLPLSSSCLFSASRLASPLLRPSYVPRKRENSELFRHCFLCLCLFLLLLTLTLAMPLNFTAFVLVSWALLFGAIGVPLACLRPVWGLFVVQSGWTNCDRSADYRYCKQIPWPLDFFSFPSGLSNSISLSCTGFLFGLVEGGWRDLRPLT
jgi:hypothetical protein